MNEYPGLKSGVCRTLNEYNETNDAVDSFEFYICNSSKSLCKRASLSLSLFSAFKGDFVGRYSHIQRHVIASMATGFIARVLISTIGHLTECIFPKLNVFESTHPDLAPGLQLRHEGDPLSWIFNCVCIVICLKNYRCFDRLGDSLFVPNVKHRHVLRLIEGRCNVSRVHVAPAHLPVNSQLIGSEPANVCILLRTSYAQSYRSGNRYLMIRVSRSYAPEILSLLCSVISKIGLLNYYWIIV